MGPVAEPPAGICGGIRCGGECIRAGGGFAAGICTGSESGGMAVGETKASGDKNLVCLDLEELHEEFHLAVDRVRRKQRLIPTFFKGAGLAL